MTSNTLDYVESKFLGAEVECLGLGTSDGSYPGVWTNRLKRIVMKTIQSPTLHLFSGSSDVGDERIDYSHEKATIRDDVFHFIRNDKRTWKFVVIDPPYELENPMKYDKPKAISSDVPLRRELSKWLMNHAENIIWIDFCSPVFTGFRRKKTWIFFPGGFHRIRIMTLLERKERLDSYF